MSVTASVCLSLLLSGGPVMGPALPSEEAAAAEWLKSLNVAQPSPSQISDTLRNWQIWKTATPEARDANLSLELRSLAPEDGKTVVTFSGRAMLEQASRGNLARLKDKIARRIQISDEPSPEARARIAEMSANIAFHYLRPNPITKHTGAHGPIPSSRELAKIGLDFGPGFYSGLVRNSPSVAFTIVATKAKTAPYSLNAQVPFDALRLNDELARESGFVLPNFQNPQALISFFSDWEPELIETLMRRNRMSLPYSIKTAREFQLYLDPLRIKDVFPVSSAFERMSVLRERLIDYVLTEADARELLHWAFARWLGKTAVSDPAEFGRLQTEFRMKAGPQSVFAKKFLPELGLPNLAVRVPLAVGPEAYSILEVENLAYNPFPDYGRKPQPRWDSRRLDHESMP